MDLTFLNELHFWGNSGKAYVIALLIFVIGLVFFKVFSLVVLSRFQKIAKKTKTDIDDFFLTIFKNIKPPFYCFVSFYVAVLSLSFSPLVDKVIFGAFIIITVAQAVLTSQKLVDFVVAKKFIKQDDDKDDGDRKSREAIMKLIGQLLKYGIAFVGILLILSNLGVDVTSLIAGMGIGGIAIALAIQSVLGDMFASFSIFMDKPFKVGQFIAISPEEKGTVEKIGIKTTRIRTQQGQQLILSNKKLTEATIQNYKRMEKRRVAYDIGVAYETPLEKLKKIPEIVKEIIKKQKNVEEDSVNVRFMTYGDFSLNFSIIYILEKPDFKSYAKVQEAINYEIFEVFQKEGIEFAYPTQNIILQNSGKAE